MFGNNIVAIPGANHVVMEASQCVPNEILQQIERDALQRAMWSWNDIMVAFNEIGYDPSQNEKERILNALAIKKAKSMLFKAGF